MRIQPTRVCGLLVLPLLVSSARVLADDNADWMSKVSSEVFTGFTENEHQLVIVEIGRPRAEPARPEFLDRYQRTSSMEGLSRAVVSASTKRALKSSKRAILDRVRRRSNLSVNMKHEYVSFPLMAVEVDLVSLEELAQMADVVAVHANSLNTAEVSSSVPFTGFDLAVTQGWGGAGTAAAILDSTVMYWDEHFGQGCPDRGEWNPAQDTQPLIPPDDCAVGVWADFNRYSGEENNDPHEVAEGLTHGTRLAGIVRAVAPDTVILSLNVFFRASGGAYFAYDTDIIAALDWLAEWSEQSGIAYEVVSANISIGYDRQLASPCNEVNFQAAFETLWNDNNIAIAVASGNDRTKNWLSKPACVTLSLSTAAVWDTDLVPQADTECESIDPFAGQVACISNLNGMLDFVAPGMQVQGLPWADPASGTSLATPHVAGAVAVLQSAAIETDGDVWPTRTVHRMLKLAAAPAPHAGLVYSRLVYGGLMDWRYLVNFASFSQESEQSSIPVAPSSYRTTVDIADVGATVGGVYLYLEVIHPFPEAVEVTLSSPSGESVSFSLPAGTANFNSVIGKEYYPGILESFKGGPLDGTWSLDLSDISIENRGHYIGASLFFTEPDCVAECAAESPCGHDGCGGSCGECPAPSRCSVDGVCTVCVPLDCAARQCGDDGCGGSCGSCDDGVFCNGIESCVNRRCQSGTAACDDGLFCNGEAACDEATQSCTPVNIPDCSDDGLFCNGVESCNELLDECVSSGSPCDPQCEACIEEDDLCASVEGTCDDGDPLTVEDMCQPDGSCRGEPVLPDTETDSDTGTEVVGDTGTAPGTEQDSESSVDAGLDSESSSGSSIQYDTDTDMDAGAAGDSDENPGTEEETESSGDTGSEPIGDSDTTAVFDTGSDTEVLSDTDSRADPEIATETESTLDTESRIDTTTVTETASDDDAVPDTGTQSDTVTGIDVDTDVGSEDDTETGSETGRRADDTDAEDTASDHRPSDTGDTDLVDAGDSVASSPKSCGCRAVASCPSGLSLFDWVLVLFH